MTRSIDRREYAQIHGNRPGHWGTLPKEELIEPERPIIDPHHHIWGPPRDPYLAPAMLADMRDGHNVVATVYVECSEGYFVEGPPELRCVGETRFARQAAIQNTGLCAAIVGYADLAAGASVRKVLEAHVSAGEGAFQGVRQSAAWNADPAVRTTLRTVPGGLLSAPSFREGFAELQALGLSFDAWVYHTQLHEVAALADAFPDQGIVLNHAGGPIGIGSYAQQREQTFHAWSQGMRSLANRQNVVVKLGGLGMRLAGFGFHEQSSPPDSTALAQAWKPYFETCVQAFGPERTMFESNFPVDGLSTSYRTLWNAFKRLAIGCSESEKDQLFSRTAGRVYRIAL